MQTHDYMLMKKNFDYINPVVCGYEYCLPNHTTHMQQRNYWILHFVFSGTGIYRANHKTNKLTSDDCFVIRPGVNHYYQADSQNPWHYAWIGFENTSVSLPETLKEDVFHAPELRNIFQSFEDNFGKKEYVEELLYGKLFELLAILHNRDIDKPSLKSYDIIAEKAKAYIENNYMNNLSISKIASQLSFDRTYFSAAFKKSTGVSPQKYLLNQRMVHAASLLKETDYSVTKIAQMTGYKDVLSFSRSFKDYYGVSPSKYVSTTFQAEQKKR